MAVRAVGVGDLTVDVPPGRLRALARYGLSAKAWTLRRLSPQRRTATLLAAVWQLELDATDDALILLDQVTDVLLSQATREHKDRRYKQLPELDRAARALRAAVLVLLDPPPGGIEELWSAIAAHVPRSELDLATDTVQRLVSQPDPQDGQDAAFREELLRRYQSLRRFMPVLLDTVVFEAAPGGQAVLAAMASLRALEGRAGRVSAATVSLKVVNGRWRRLVLANPQLGENEVDRRAYCAGLSLDPAPQRALEQLSAQLDSAYRQTAERLDDNLALEIAEIAGDDRPDLSKLEALDQPEQLIALRATTTGMLPDRVAFSEVLLEVCRWTGFADAFTHLSEGRARATDLHISVCAVLMAEACNISLTDVAQPSVPALSYNRLSWVSQNYVRAETIAAANERLAWLCAAAASTWSRDGSKAPKLIASKGVWPISNGRSKAYTMASRSAARVSWRRARPSSVISPQSGSISRPARLASVDLPDLDLPTTATAQPPGTVRSSPLSTAWPSRRTGAMGTPWAAARAWIRQEASPRERNAASGASMRCCSWAVVPAAATVRAPASASSSHSSPRPAADLASRTGRPACSTRFPKRPTRACRAPRWRSRRCHAPG